MAVVMKFVMMNSSLDLNAASAAGVFVSSGEIRSSISESFDDHFTRTLASSSASPSSASPSSSSTGGSSEQLVGGELFDIPSWMAILLALIYFSVSFCAVIGNWMVLWIVIRSKIMRNVTNLFIANLALADIMIGALAIPFQFQAALLQKWLLPYFMCSFCPTIQVVSLNVSIFTLVTLSIDRHRAVTQPLKPRISKKTGYLIISGIWIISILTAVPTLLAYQITFVQQSASSPTTTTTAVTGSSIMFELSHNDSSKYNNINNYSLVDKDDASISSSSHHNQADDLVIPIQVHGNEILNEESSSGMIMNPMCWPTGLPEDFWKTYNHVLVALQYMLPIIIISIAYIHMAIVLSSGPGIMNESRSESDRVNHSKRRVIKMLFIVIAIFAICWLPFQAYNILQEIYPGINDYKYINLIWFSCHLFAMSNSCYNPFIYAIYGEKFNQEFRHRFYCCCFWASRISSTGTSGGTTSGMTPATPTALRSGDLVTHSQHTHSNDNNSSSICMGGSERGGGGGSSCSIRLQSKHQVNNYPLIRIKSSSIAKQNSSSKKQQKHNTSTSKSPAFQNSSSSPDSDCNNRHTKHLLCRKGKNKNHQVPVTKVNNGHHHHHSSVPSSRKDQHSYQISEDIGVGGGGHSNHEDCFLMMDEKTTSPLLPSPITSEREVCLSLSSSGCSRKSMTMSACHEPLLTPDPDPGQQKEDGEADDDDDDDGGDVIDGHPHVPAAATDATGSIQAGIRDSKVSYV